MRSARVVSSVAVACVMVLGFQATGATTTHDWLGAEVSITTPDDVFYGRPFSVSFSVDSSALPPENTLAFETFLDASDTIDMTTSTWEYTFASDELVWNFTLYGVLGDAVTPISYTSGQYSIRLYDPINGERTWIWSDYNDRVEWTLHNLVLLDDTSFALTLDEYFAVPTTFFFAVTGSPESVPAVPLPALLGAVFGLLAAAAHETARRPCRVESLRNRDRRRRGR